ncbi:hypothetical protein SHIRM173S_01868 [Streptomyces hirsutus]
MSAPRTQSQTPARTFAQRFSATRRGARLARLLAAHQLTEWGHPHGTEAHDTAVLVVAELASNSVLHGHVPGRDFALSLSLDDSRGVVRIEVTDTHPAQPARLALGPDEDGGRRPAPRRRARRRLGRQRPPRPRQNGVGGVRPGSLYAAWALMLSRAPVEGRPAERAGRCPGNGWVGVNVSRGIHGSCPGARCPGKA